jgi:hypothetical protein
MYGEMDRKTRESLDAIEKIKSPDDIIYEIFRTEKGQDGFIFGILYLM